MTTRTPGRIAAGGLIALAVAMGVGRFAFTPLLPMMMAEGTVTIAGASLLASSNYLGYLLGALACTFQPWLWRRFGFARQPSAPALVRSGLVSVCVLTFAMALPWPAAWPALRFAAGVASAVVLVFTSGWCLEQLSRLHAPQAGALVYVGPGAGIVVTGLAIAVLLAMHAGAASAWLLSGLLGTVLSAFAWRVFVPSVPGVAPAAAPEPAADRDPRVRSQLTLLSLAYGLAGLGYIVTATFLPVIARGALPASHWLDLFWPTFGIGVMAGALGASRLRARGDLRLRLALGYAIQAVAIALPLLWASVAGFVVGSFLLGLPFTAITFFALQEARRIAPAHATRSIGLLTSLYGIGQIAGPPLAGALVAHSATPAAGFAIALAIAAAVLVFGALLFIGLAKAHPPARA